MTSNSDPSELYRWRRTVATTLRVRPVVVVGAAVAAPLVLTAVLLPFRAQLPDATLALSLAVLVSLLASIGTRVTALIAAVSAAVCFDVAFTEPYGSLVISHPQDVETTVLLLIGGLVVGQLSARNRSNRQLAAQTGKDLGHIQAVAETMAAGAAPDEVVAAVAVELESLLGLRNCWFETSQPDRPVPTINQNGDVSWGRNWWGFDSLGLPGKEITLEVEHDQRRLGRFVLVADPGTRVRRNQLLAAVTLAEQAGAALGAGASPVTLARS